jgi:peroxiredoxin
MSLRPAPEWEAAEWLNTPAPLALADLRGRVVVMLAFQMLCPGCVDAALPQLKRVHDTFDPRTVAAIGFHTVFEHHEAMPPASLKAFLLERRFDFPVAVDARDDLAEAIPATMRRYRMQGTPTLVLIDAEGRLRQQAFGHVPDLRLGAAIMALVAEARQGAAPAPVFR